MKDLLEQFIAQRHAFLVRRSRTDDAHTDLASGKNRRQLIGGDLARIANLHADDRRTEIRGER